MIAAFQARFDSHIHFWNTLIVVPGIGNCEAASLAGLFNVSSLMRTQTPHGPWALVAV